MVGQPVIKEFVEIEYLLEPADLVAFAQEQRKTTGKTIAQRVPGTKLFWWVVPTAILVAGVILDQGGIGVIVVYLGLFLAVLLWQKYYFSKVFGVYYSDEFAHGMTGKKKVRATADFFIETGLTKEVHVLWSGIESITSTDRHILVWANKISAHVIPRRAFRDDVEYHAFIKDLKNFWEDGRESKTDPPASSFAA